MLYLGPRHFSFHNAFPVSLPKAPAKRAREIILNAIHSMRNLGMSDTSPFAKVAHNLAELPSYQFFPALSASFVDPDAAFQHGIFRRIKAASIDLPSPRPPPNPNNARLWIHRLPTKVRHMFEEAASHSFHEPTVEHVNHAKKYGSLPRARVCASKREYVALLEKAEHAGMLHWAPVSDECGSHTTTVTDMEMTLFAVSKSHDRSRLISWPRVQNDAIPKPPYISLPNPTLFEAISIQGSNAGAFFLDIANMFHNITLPLWLAHLFPMKPGEFSDLAIETQLRIANRNKIPSDTSNLLVRPFQATMPMGCKWAVFIAHTFVSSCFDQSFRLLSSSKAALPSMKLGKLQAEDAPFLVEDRSPLLLHIIDDAVAVTVDWPPELVRTWHRFTREILRINRLPVADNKSSDIFLIVRDLITFIGCTWNLQRGIIKPSSDKLQRILAHAKPLLEATSATAKDWERKTGKLVWFAMLNRLLLSWTQTIFSVRDTTKPKCEMINGTPNKRELRTLTALLPLAPVDIKMPLSHIIVAFDASKTAGAVTYTHATTLLANRLWNAARNARFSPKWNRSDQLREVVKVLSGCHWKLAFTHHWKTAEHINCLEACMAVLSVEWLTRARITQGRVTILPD